MSIECGECERDLRGGHDPSCSRYRPKLPQEVYEAAWEAWKTGPPAYQRDMLLSAIDAAFAASPYGDLLRLVYVEQREFCRAVCEGSGGHYEECDDMRAVLARTEGEE